MHQPKTLVSLALFLALLAMPLLAQGKGRQTPPTTADLVGLSPGSHQLKVMNADGSNLRTVVGENLLYTTPTISPDGRQVTLGRRYLGVSAIWAINIDGTGMREVTRLQGYTNWSNGIPVRAVWSPVRIGSQHKLLYVDRAGQYDQLFVVNLDGTGVTQLTSEPTGVNGLPVYEWSPNATRICYVDNTWNPAPRLIDADLAEVGGVLSITTRRVLPDVGIQPRWVAWANHSDRLVLADSGSRGYDLWLLDLVQPSQPVQLTNSPPAEHKTPAFSADDRRVFHSMNEETWVLNADGSGTPERITNKLYWCYHRRG